MPAATKTVHRCQAAIALDDFVPNTKTVNDHRVWGSAIEAIERTEDGAWWALSGSREYATPILYCPFCGSRLRD